MRRALASLVLVAMMLGYPAGAHALPSAPAVDAMLADDWCGTERTADDQDSGPRLPYYKVVYAYAADVGDRFTQFASPLERYAKAAGAKVAMFSDKTIRFDRRTSCGPRYLDIRTLALPGSAAYYDAGIVTRLPDALGALLPQGGSRRNYLVFVDLGTTSDYYALAQPYDDDRPGPENVSNTHAQPALAYIVGGGAPDFWPTDGTRTPAQFADTILQEILHNLGAVQKSAPHSSGDWHCWQGWDVMCYQAQPSLPALQYDCAWHDVFRDLGAPLDCGGDDYFNPSPAPGSYLDTHWNTYNSIYLCRVDDCGAVPRDAPASPAPAPAAEPATPPLVQTHVIRRSSAPPLRLTITDRRTASAKAILVHGLRITFSASRGGIPVRGTLRTRGRVVAVAHVVAAAHGTSTAIVFRLSRAQRRRLARERRTAFDVVLTADGAKPATATIVVRRAAARAP